LQTTVIKNGKAKYPAARSILPVIAPKLIRLQTSVIKNGKAKYPAARSILPVIAPKPLGQFKLLRIYLANFS
jgi:hypothetical protein